MSKKIEWKTEKRKLSDLIEYDKNPRKITSKQKSDLKKSLKKFGLAEIPVIDIDNTLIAGHQRTKVLLEIEGPDFEIDVRVPNRELSEKEFQEYNVRSNKNSGEWDFDILEVNFNEEDLYEWGFEDDVFGNEKKEAKEINIKTLFQLNLNFKNEEELKEHYDKLVEMGYDVDITLI